MPPYIEVPYMQVLPHMEVLKTHKMCTTLRVGSCSMVSVETRDLAKVPLTVNNLLCLLLINWVTFVSLLSLYVYNQWSAALYVQTVVGKPLDLGQTKLKSRSMDPAHLIFGNANIFLIKIVVNGFRSFNFFLFFLNLFLTCCSLWINQNVCCWLIENYCQRPSKK